MESFKTLFKKLIHDVSSKASVFATFILICTYHVCDKDMACTCEPGGSGCKEYIAMPCFIIFFIVLCTDMSFQRACRYTCRHKRCDMLCVLIRQVIQASCMGLLWAVSVLIDADWFVCCEDDQSKYQAALACKAKTNITLEEHAIMAKLKNKSRMIGLAVVLSITCVATLWSSVDWLKCSPRCKTPEKHLFHELILEQTENEITNSLKEAAKDKVTEQIKVCMASQDWTTISDVAGHLIGNSPYTPVPPRETPPPPQPTEPMEEMETSTL